MKNWQFLMLMGAIYNTPHVSSWVGMGCAGAFTICAVVFFFMEWKK